MEFSRRNLLELDASHVMDTADVPTIADDVLAAHEYVRIDNSHLSAAEVAARIVASFDFG